MFERYTEDARRAIYFARTEALGREASEIGTRELLLGLAYRLYPEGSPFAMLQTRRAELLTLIGAMELAEVPVSRDIPLSRESKVALNEATNEANRERSFSIQPQHLLMGIVRGGDSTAVALIHFGWNLQLLRSLTKESRRLFPPKRPPLPRVLRHYRKHLTAGIALLLFVAIIFYLRWQQR